MPAWSWEVLRPATTIVEDEAILALNKPTGISVMGERHETDLVQLAAEAGEQLFPVHRIDKVTSGVVLFAKSLPIHGGLTRQFNKRTADKRYLLITAAAGLPAEGEMDLPLSTGRKGTVRIAAPRDRIRWEEREHRWWVAPQDMLDKTAYPSITRFVTAWRDPGHSVVAAEPVTGRRHQLRVHFAWVGHPILGDPLFDRAAAAAGQRTCLHSWRLVLDAAWRDGPGRRLQIEAPPGDDFWQPVADRLPAGSRTGIVNLAREHPFLGRRPR